LILNEEWVHLSVQVKNFILQEENFTVVMLQNLHHELEQKEVEAWEKLINVLTHEIMNSVTPIFSLSNAINTMIKTNSELKKAFAEMDEEDRSDFTDSLKTIEDRSKGLLNFVNAYRDYSIAPEFSPKEFDFLNTLNKVRSLMKQELEQNKIQFEIDFGTLRTLKATGDENLIQQVIINLVKNSIYALMDTDQGKIELKVKRIGDHKVHLIVSDNGPGIPEEIIERIFVPFYTTRKGGSGIGLSLSRQIMKLHNGSIKVNSVKDKGASFTIEF